VRRGKKENLGHINFHTIIGVGRGAEGLLALATTPRTYVTGMIEQKKMVT